MLRMPLETLRLIIRHAETQLSYSELLQLRLVNSTFEKEVLWRMFSDNRPDNEARFINANVWHRAPQSLREKYMRFRLRMQRAESSLFAYLFVPVYERCLAEYGIQDGTAVRREDMLKRLLRLVHPNLQMGRVVAHKSSKTPATIERTFPSKAREHSLYPEQKTREQLRQQQIEDDYTFIRFSFAVQNNDDTAALKVLEQFPDSKRRSLLFGTSISGFCLRHGSINLLRRMLELRPTIIPEKKYNYAIFAAASERSSNSFEAMNLLLDCYSTALQHPLKRRQLLEFLAWHAGKSAHLPVILTILSWLDSHWHPGHSCFPLTHNSYLQNAYAAERWFNDPACKTSLLHLTYTNLLHLKPLLRVPWPRALPPPTVHANRKFPGPEPDIGLLYLLLAHGIAVDKRTPNARYFRVWNWATRTLLFMATWRGLPAWSDAVLRAGAKPSVVDARELLWSAERVGIWGEMRGEVGKWGMGVEGKDQYGEMVARG